MHEWMNEWMNEWMRKQKNGFFYLESWWTALTIVLEHPCDHSNTPGESKHLSFSFCAPRLFIVNWSFFLGKKTRWVSNAYKSGGEPPPCTAPMILPQLTPHTSFVPPNQVICITPWILPKGKKIYYVLNSVEKKEGKHGTRVQRGRSIVSKQEEAKKARQRWDIISISEDWE